MSGQRHKRIILSLKNIAILFIIAIALTFGLVFGLGHKSVFTELQVTFSIITICLFIFMLVGLYNGITIAKEKDLRLKNNPFDSLGIPDLSGFSPDINLDFDFGDDLVGAIIGIVVWVVVSIGILMVLTGFLSFLWGIVLALGAALYWIFYKALRRVFAKSGKCRGNLLQSVKYSLFYTLLYTGWFYILVAASKIIIKLI